MDHRHEKRPRQIPDAEKHRVFYRVPERIFKGRRERERPDEHHQPQRKADARQHEPEQLLREERAENVYVRAEESERCKQNEPEQRGFFEIIAERAEKGRAVPMPRFADHVPHRRAERRGRSAERENRQRAHDPQNVQPRELRRLREKAQDGGIRIKDFFHIATSGRISLLYRNK